MHEAGETLWARRHDRILRAGRGVELCFGCGGYLAPGTFECPKCGPVHFGARPRYLRRVLGKLAGVAFLALVAFGALQLVALLAGK